MRNERVNVSFCKKVDKTVFWAKFPKVNKIDFSQKFSFSWIKLSWIKRSVKKKWIKLALPSHINYVTLSLNALIMKPLENFLIINLKIFSITLWSYKLSDIMKIKKWKMVIEIYLNRPESKNVVLIRMFQFSLWFLKFSFKNFQIQFELEPGVSDVSFDPDELHHLSMYQ